MAVYRVNKNRGYTVMANFHLRDKCILQLRGVRPFLSNKYDITKHPKYKLLSDFDKRNAFDIEKYRSRKLVVKPTDTFDLYDMGEVEAE